MATRKCASKCFILKELFDSERVASAKKRRISRSNPWTIAPHMRGDPESAGTPTSKATYRTHKNAAHSPKLHSNHICTRRALKCPAAGLHRCNTCDREYPTPACLPG